MRERAPLKHIYFHVSKYLLHLQAHSINAVPLGMVWRYMTTIYQQNTNIEKVYVYASEHSERAWNSHISKKVFLSILCWYFLYFVGTNDMFVGLHVPLNFQMYQQNSKKALWGHAIAPPPPWKSCRLTCNNSGRTMSRVEDSHTLLLSCTTAMTTSMSQKRRQISARSTSSTTWLTQTLAITTVLCDNSLRLIWYTFDIF